MKYAIGKREEDIMLLFLPDYHSFSAQIIRIPIQEFEPFIRQYTNETASCITPEAIGPRMEYIFIKQNDSYKKISFSRIRWLEASRSYCYIHLDDGSRIILTHCLSDIEKYLPEENFIRIHRSFVVNTDAVDSFIGNMVRIGKQSLPISQQYRQHTQSRFHFLK